MVWGNSKDEESGIRMLREIASKWVIMKWGDGSYEDSRLGDIYKGVVKDKTQEEKIFGRVESKFHFLHSYNFCNKFKFF